MENLVHLPLCGMFVLALRLVALTTLRRGSAPAISLVLWMMMVHVVRSLVNGG
jgi:hypothetical protein